MTLLQFTLPYFAALAAFSLAVVVLVKDRRSLVHWVLAIGLVLLAAESFFAGRCINASMPWQAARWMAIRNIPASMLPGTWLVFSLMFSAKAPMLRLKRWRWRVLLLYAAPVAILAASRGALFSEYPVSVPPGMWGFFINGWGMAFQLCVLVGALLALMLLEKTLKQATGNFRWQVKFVIIGLGCILIARIFIVSQAILFHSIRMEWEMVNVGAIVVGVVMMARSLMRTRTLDIEFYASNAVIYHSLTIILVGAYFIIVGMAAKLFFILDAAQAISFISFAVILSLTGAVAFLLSDRYRKRLKRFISRHFKRPIYDYRREWANFTHETSSARDIRMLCHTAADIVAKTFDSLAITIWIREGAGGSVRIGASTIFSELKHETTLGGKALKLIQAVESENIPMEMDYEWDELPQVLREVGEDFFKSLEMRYCIPLKVKNEFVGILTLGKRVGKDAPLSIEDFDLLSTMADQLAANVQNIQLSERLRCINALMPWQAARWMAIRNIPAAMLPGTWPVFSLMFSAKAPMLRLKRWRWRVLLLYAAPVAVLAASRGAVFSEYPVPVPPGMWGFFINGWGMPFQLCVIGGALLALMVLKILEPKVEGFHFFENRMDLPVKGKAKSNSKSHDLRFSGIIAIRSTMVNLLWTHR